MQRSSRLVYSLILVRRVKKDDKSVMLIWREELVYYKMPRGVHGQASFETMRAFYVFPWVCIGSEMEMEVGGEWL